VGRAVRSSHCSRPFHPSHVQRTLLQTTQREQRMRLGLRRGDQGREQKQVVVHPSGSAGKLPFPRPHLPTMMGMRMGRMDTESLLHPPAA
jgi:hypothetical protein